MVLVYALTRATQSGWTSLSTIALLAVAALLGAGSWRSSGGLTRRSCRSRCSVGNTLATANVITTIIASIAFSQFFLLTLYLSRGCTTRPQEAGSPSRRSPAPSP